MARAKVVKVENDAADQDMSVLAAQNQAEGQDADLDEDFDQDEEETSDQESEEPVLKKNALARKPEKKMVKRRLFKDNDKYQGNVFVCVNGKAYSIERGVEVEIPEEVAEVLDNAENQFMNASDAMERAIYQDPK